MLPGVTAWIVTDGKAGDESQCLGVAEALGVEAQIRRVRPRAPYTWAMPFGPIDPREAPGRPDSPIRPPFPDLLIASGRRAVAYARHVKRASRARTFTVILKDPRTGRGAADLIWVPAHDGLRGHNVVVTLTAPHRLSAAKLAQARASPPPGLAALSKPPVAVLVGGDSRHHHFTAQDIATFVGRLAALAASGATLMVTTSRRTPKSLAEELERLIGKTSGYLWDGHGDNPLIAMLALAEAVVVTADSTNMIGEAAATGAPVLVYEPSGGNRRLARYLAALMEAGIVHSFSGRLAGSAYPPLDSTPIIAEAIMRAYRTRSTDSDQS